MTLRGRLAVAFAGILLAPMLVGLAALAGVVPYAAAEASSRAEIVDRAGTAVRAVVAARCRNLEVTAASAAQAAGAAGESWVVTPANASGPGRCAAPTPRPRSRLLVPTGPAARAEIRGTDGLIGYAYAVQPLNTAFLAELSAAAGTRLRLSLDGSLATFPDQPLGLDSPRRRKLRPRIRSRCLWSAPRSRLWQPACSVGGWLISRPGPFDSFYPQWTVRRPAT